MIKSRPLGFLLGVLLFLTLTSSIQAQSETDHVLPLQYVIDFVYFDRTKDYVEQLIGRSLIQEEYNVVNQDGQEVLHWMAGYGVELEGEQTGEVLMLIIYHYNPDRGFTVERVDFLDMPQEFMNRSGDIEK